MNRAGNLSPAVLAPGAGGFTLMELLVTLAILLALTLIVIPNLAGFRIDANENSAIASVRQIYEAEQDYRAKFPVEGFACSLSQLGGDLHHGSATPQAALLLAPDLAGGYKSGYTFRIDHCTSASADRPDQYTGFEIIALPQTPGKTGHRGFCESAAGVEKSDPAGGENCSVSLE